MKVHLMIAIQTIFVRSLLVLPVSAYSVLWDQPFWLEPMGFKFLQAFIPDGTTVHVSARAEVDITFDIVKGSCNTKDDLALAYANSRVYKSVRGMIIEFSIVVTGAKPWGETWTFIVGNTDPLAARHVYSFLVAISPPSQTETTEIATITVTTEKQNQPIIPSIAQYTILSFVLMTAVVVTWFFIARTRAKYFKKSDELLGGLACPECGFQNQMGSNYCSKCGFSLKTSETEDWSGVTEE